MRGLRKKDVSLRSGLLHQDFIGQDDYLPMESHFNILGHHLDLPVDKVDQDN